MMALQPWLVSGTMGDSENLKEVARMRSVLWGLEPESLIQLR